MFDALLDQELDFANTKADKQSAEQSEYSSFIKKAIYFRELIYKIVDKYLDPNTNNPKAVALQDSLNIQGSIKTPVELYQNKYQKAKILESFVDEIFNNPDAFALNFDFPASINDKKWTKKLLVYDFLFYGPVTPIAIRKIVESHEDKLDNPILQLLDSKISNQIINEVRVNNATDIYYESNNRIHKWEIPFLHDAQIVQIIERIISESNQLNASTISINVSSPIADFEHPCGYIRGAAVIPPAAESPFFTLRVHPENPYTLQDLLEKGMLSDEMREFLRACQLAGTTIAIAGTMGSGKTTLLSALSELWPDKGRKATIEDTPELKPNLPDLVKMRTIEYDNDNVNDIDVKRLTKACKRHSVRYVVLSEARDFSAWEILQLSQSILGCLMTFHYTLRSNKFRVDQALNTLAALCKQHPLAPKDDDIKHSIGDMVQILLLVEQSPIDNVRRVTNIYLIQGYDPMNGGHFKYTELFEYNENKEVYRKVNPSQEFTDYLKNKGIDYHFPA